MVSSVSRSPAARNEFVRTRTSSASRSSHRTWSASTRSTNGPTWHGIPTTHPEFPPFLGSRGRLLPEGPLPRRGTAEVRTAGAPSPDLSREAPPLLRCEDGLSGGRALHGPSDGCPGGRADPRTPLGHLCPSVPPA